MRFMQMICEAVCGSPEQAELDRKLEEALKHCRESSKKASDVVTAVTTKMVADLNRNTAAMTELMRREGGRPTKSGRFHAAGN